MKTETILFLFIITSLFLDKVQSVLRLPVAALERKHSSWNISTRDYYLPSVDFQQNSTLVPSNDCFLDLSESTVFLMENRSCPFRIDATNSSSCLFNKSSLCANCFRCVGTFCPKGCPLTAFRADIDVDGKKVSNDSVVVVVYPNITAARLPSNFSCSIGLDPPLYLQNEYLFAEETGVNRSSLQWLIDWNDPATGKQSSYYVKGIPTTEGASLEWSEPRIISHLDCPGKTRFTIYDVSICDFSFSNKFGTNYVAYFSSIEPCLLLPDDLYAAITSWLDGIECSRDTNYCKVKPDFNRQNFEQTKLKFRLGPDEQWFNIPLHLLLFNESTQSRLCISKNSRASLITTVPEIVFGTRVLEHLYLAYDSLNSTFGLGSKYPDETKEVKNACAVAKKCTKFYEVYDPHINECIPLRSCRLNSFNDFRENIQDCDAVNGIKFLFFFLVALIGVSEFRSMYLYDRISVNINR